MKELIAKDDDDDWCQCQCSHGVCLDFETGGSSAMQEKPLRITKSMLFCTKRTVP